MKWESLIGVALWALIPGFIALKKGRSFIGYYLLSFIITPLISMIITICLSNLKKEQNSNSSSLTRSPDAGPDGNGMPFMPDSHPDISEEEKNL